MEDKRFNRAAFIIISISFFIRVILVFYFSKSWITIDSGNYILQAEELLKGSYSVYFPNGFPLLIAFVTQIFGNDNRAIVLIILNVLMSTGSVLLFGLVIKKYLGINLFSLIALTLFAFYPNQLNYVRFILTEVPALFFLLLSFYFLSYKKLSLSALSIGIALTIKTALLPVLLFVGIYLFTKKYFMDGLKFYVIALAPLFVMMIYGLIITGKFSIGYNSAHNFYLTAGEPKLVSNNLWDALLYYFNFAVSQPVQFITQRLSSIWEYWGFLPSATDGLLGNLFFRLLIGLRFPLLLLAVYGFIKSKKDLTIMFSAITILSISFLHILLFSNPRFNFMMEPFMILLGVVGLNTIVSRKDKKPQGDFK